MTTIVGRRRYLARPPPAGGGGGGGAAAAAAEAALDRQAVNSIVQGSAADVLKLATACAHARLARWRVDDGAARAPGATAASQARARDPAAAAAAAPPRLVLQIHDELVFEVPAKATCIQQLQALLRAAMVDDVRRELALSVPLAVKMFVGKSWGDLRPVLEPPPGA